MTTYVIAIKDMNDFVDSLDVPEWINSFLKNSIEGIVELDESIIISSVEELRGYLHKENCWSHENLDDFLEDDEFIKSIYTDSVKYLEKGYNILWIVLSKNEPIICIFDNIPNEYTEGIPIFLIDKS